MKALIFDYGQKNGEVERALNNASKLGLKNESIKIPGIRIKGGDIYYRNLIFLSYALHVAVSEGYKEIVYSITSPHEYSDTSPEFIGSFTELCRPSGVKLKIPLLSMTRLQVLRKAKEMGIDLSNTITCNNSTRNCGVCKKCVTLDYANRYVGAEIPKFERRPQLFSFEYSHRKRGFDLPENFFLNEFRLYINNKCNLSCNYCYYGYPSSEGELSLGDWMKAVNVGYNNGVRLFHICGKEPLIDDKVFYLVRHIKSLGAIAEVITNGMTLNKYVDSINNSGLDKLLVSFDYEDKKKNFEKLQAMGRITVPKEAYLVFDRKGLPHAKELVEELWEDGIRKFYFRFMQPRRVEPTLTENFVSREKQKEAIENILSYEIDNSNFSIPIEWRKVEEKWGWIYEMFKQYQNGETPKKVWKNNGAFVGSNVIYPIFHPYCEEYMNKLTILHDGTVVGCTKHSWYDWETIQKNYSIGNILEINLKEEVMKKIKTLNREKVCFHA